MKSRIAVMFAVVLMAFLVHATAASAATITVNGTANLSANDGACTLREAIIAANTDSGSGAAAGECSAGAGTDTITFSGAFNGNVATSTISTAATGLPSITQPVTLNGGNCGSPKPCVGIDAGGQGGLSVDTGNVTISGLAISDASGASSAALFLGSSPSDTGIVARNLWLGIRLDQTVELNQNGIVVVGDGTTIGGTSVNDRNVLARAVTAHVRVVGADNVRVQGNFIGTLADGITTTGTGGLQGVQVVGDTAANAAPPVGTLIGGPETGSPGTCEAPCNVISGTIGTGIDLQGGGGTVVPAGQTAIEGNFIGFGVNGASIGTAGVGAGQADDVTVGGDVARRNYVSKEIRAVAGATNFEAIQNFVGLSPNGSTRVDDATIRLGDFGQPIVGPVVRANRIASTPGSGAPIDLAANNGVVQGNVIGIGTGNENVGGGGVSVNLQGGSGNLIGGPGPGDGNVIGNSSLGIAVGGVNATVAGNFIGTDPTETQAHAISGRGLIVAGDGHTIGGTAAGAENAIANVSDDAIVVQSDGSDLNQILRNHGTAGAGQEFVELNGTPGPGNGATGPNNAIERPTITAGATSALVSGTGGLPGATVRVYTTTSTAGATGPRVVTAYAGQATADGSGNWTLACPSAGCEVGLPGGGQLTANQIATSGDSSEMADPKAYTDLPPETTITGGPLAGATTGVSPQFEFASSEPGSTFACSVDGGAFTGCTSPLTLGPLTEGPHTFAVRATDGTSNPDASPATRSFTVDATAPQTEIDSGPGAGETTEDSTPTFDFSATEPGSTFECRVDAQAFTACSGPDSTHTTADLADGAHTFEVRATDPFGNLDATPAARSFVVDVPDPPAPPDTSDKRAPETTISKAPKRKSSKRKAKFAFSSDEPGSRFECKLDKGGFVGCSANAKFKVKPGKHALEVRAVDTAGNVDATPAKAKWKVKR
jgi:CSLREA domain-containing protein